jgi:hypothetical protein
MTRTARQPLLGFCLLVTAGCFDFLDPDLPETGAPVVLETNLSFDETGLLQAGALLAPALTVDGFRRAVLVDTLRVSSVAITPDSVRPNGTRRYRFSTTVHDPVGFVRPLRIATPTVADVRATQPVIDWFALQRADPDTLIFGTGQDLMLNLIVEPGESRPAPDQRVWSLELVTDSGRFRLGAPGRPPPSIRVPAYWVPPSGNSRVTAYLTYFLAGTYRPAPGDYLHSLTASLRIRWNIRLQAPI